MIYDFLFGQALFSNSKKSYYFDEEVMFGISRVEIGFWIVLGLEIFGIYLVFF